MVKEGISPNQVPSKTASTVELTERDWKVLKLSLLSLQSAHLNTGSLLTEPDSPVKLEFDI